MLYSRITYSVRLDSVCSETFNSLIGILAGDPASPQLWNLYMSDFDPPSHVADITLSGISIANTEQADDMALFSTDALAVQGKMNYVYKWGAKKFLQIHKVKTVGMAYHLKPSQPLPIITLAGTPLSWVSTYTYVGVTFSNIGKNIFAKHYDEKSRKARCVAGATLGLESYIGVVPPKQGKQLYMARIDPHLTFGCEVVIDVQNSGLKQLQNVQHTYIRRMLRLNPRSMRAILHTETGIMPIAYRRVLLALKYLIYLTSLPNNHYARCALQEAINLSENSAQSWYTELVQAIEKLQERAKINVTLPVLSGQMSNQEILDLIKAIEHMCDAYLQVLIDKSPKTELLRGRLERDDKGNYIVKTMHFRHYLYVKIPRHWMALTGLLLSDNILAMEQLRRATRNRPRYPQHLRICRLCKNDIEDPIHALFVCIGSEQLISLRKQFIKDLISKASYLKTSQCMANPKELFECIYADKRLVETLARYAFRMLKIFNAVPLFLPDLPDHLSDTDAENSSDESD
ncbi:hypothetical protein SCHPADRAFT_839832 [Schizopora paradoxa]|uniref:Reverse transcriptase domain-containing protein n=1 Tax=Schizopora paradoxa TaxID=27342 RepID=A0A0H2R041_9AGAM|nr:hypothetical protein SCHPADRAFT_839832 [Schizopora paradoxa]